MLGQHHRLIGPRTTRPTPTPTSPATSPPWRLAAAVGRGAVARLRQRRRAVPARARSAAGAGPVGFVLSLPRPGGGGSLAARAGRGHRPGRRGLAGRGRHRGAAVGRPGDARCAGASDAGRLRPGGGPGAGARMRRHHLLVGARPSRRCCAGSPRPLGWRWPATSPARLPWTPPPRSCSRGWTGWSPCRSWPSSRSPAPPRPGAGDLERRRRPPARGEPPPGATRAAWGLPARARVAGYLGRLAPEKDPGAMLRLAEALPDPWHVVIVGDGREGAALAEAVARRGLDRVRLRPRDDRRGRRPRRVRRPGRPVAVRVVRPDDGRRVLGRRPGGGHAVGPGQAASPAWSARSGSRRPAASSPRRSSPITTPTAPRWKPGSTGPGRSPATASPWRDSVASGPNWSRTSPVPVGPEPAPKEGDHARRPDPAGLIRPACGSPSPARWPRAAAGRNPRPATSWRRLNAWRAVPHADQAARAEASTRTRLDPRLRDAVLACPDRGSVLPISQQDDCGCRGRELTECRAGQGALPGRVTLAECFECRASRAGAPRSLDERGPPVVVEGFQGLAGQLLEQGLVVGVLPHRPVQLPDDLLVVGPAEVVEERGGGPIAGVVPGRLRVDRTRLARLVDGRTGCSRPPPRPASPDSGGRDNSG